MGQFVAWLCKSDLVEHEQCVLRSDGVGGCDDRLSAHARLGFRVFVDGDEMGRHAFASKCACRSSEIYSAHFSLVVEFLIVPTTTGEASIVRGIVQVESIVRID